MGTVSASLGEKSVIEENNRKLYRMYLNTVKSKRNMLEMFQGRLVEEINVL